jgi:hypothetical protein
MAFIEAPYDLIISYRVPETGDGGDRSVFALKDALEARGYSVFVGEAAIEGGASWPATIQRGVSGCKAFVVLCSPTYGDAEVSPWTERELVLADNYKKPLFPVWHSGRYPPPAVAIYLAKLQRIPGGNLTAGYAAAGVPHERVAEELAAALRRAGVLPTAGGGGPAQARTKPAVADDDARALKRVKSDAASLADVLNAYVEGLREEHATVTSVFTMLQLNHGRGGAANTSTAAAMPARPLGGGLLSLDRLVKARAAGVAQGAGGAGGQRVGLSAFDKPFGRWIVTGAPGCGKSTLLKMLAMSMLPAPPTNGDVAPPPPAAPAAARQRIPLLLELGRWTPAALSSGQLLRDALSRYARRQLSAAEVSALAHALAAHSDVYDFVWILDGLDEGMLGAGGASGGQVNDTPLWHEVESLVAAHPGHAFVISSRLSHLPAGAGAFEVLYVHDLSPDERRAFIAKYLAFFDLGADVSADAVYDSVPASLAAVAVTPLALSLVVSAYVTDGAVPGSLKELYRAYVSHTLSDVEEGRGGGRRAAPASDKDMALAALAFEMLTSSRPVIDAADARVAVGRRLAQIHAAEADAAGGGGSGVEAMAAAAAVPNAAAVLEELIYSGLVRRDADYRISFAHLTLLEYLAECEMSREFSFAPKAAMDQYFLRNMAKIRVLLGAAAIGPRDAVCELGAGIGSVARHFPPCASLTLVDLDPDLVRILRYTLRAATVLEADALEALRAGAFDVVVSNLPFFLTEGILEILAAKARGAPDAGGPFRRAVMSVHTDDVFDATKPYADALDIRELCTLQSEDFFPHQPFLSKVIAVTPRAQKPQVEAAVA